VSVYYTYVSWLDDDLAKVLPRLEYRPAEEQGQIIVCFDTSASMQASWGNGASLESVVESSRDCYQGCCTGVSAWRSQSAEKLLSLCFQQLQRYKGDGAFNRPAIAAEIAGLFGMLL